MTCEDVRAEFATALLTGVPADADVSTHVASCGACAEELRALGATHALLALAPEPVVAGPHDEALLDRMLAEAARRRSHRRRVLVGAVAAAVVLPLVLVAGGVAVERASSPAAPASASVVERAAVDRSTGVAGVVRVRPVAAGSQVAMSVSGVPYGTDCTMTVVTRDGSRTVVTRWRAGYTGAAETSGTVAVSTSGIARVELADAHGRVLLPVPLA